MAHEQMIIPGGKLDPAFLDADVFLGDPAEPSVPPGRACAVARRYVELVNAGDHASVALLFRDDATLLEPRRPTLHGREQIDAFYARQVGTMKPQIVATSYLGSDTECMVSLALRTGLEGRDRYVLVSVDHFLVDEESRIISMTAFVRPMRGKS